MGSDHCPVSCHLKLNDKLLPLNASYKPRFDLVKADWNKFQNYLNDRSLKYCDLYNDDLTPEKLNSMLTTDILKAAELAIPLSKPRTGKELLKNIINLIKQKSLVMKNLKVSCNADLRRSYNDLCSEIRRKISKHKENTWQVFLDKHGCHPVANKPFWK